MKNLPNHVTLHHAEQTLFVKKETVWVLAHVFLSTLAILMLVANLNAFPTATAHARKLAFKINVKILAQEFVVLMHSAKL